MENRAKIAAGSWVISALMHLEETARRDMCTKNSAIEFSVTNIFFSLIEYLGVCLNMK